MANAEQGEALRLAARTLGFFASVIKSGESWGAVTQRDYDAANAAIAEALKSPTADVGRLREALALAANRLNRCAVDAIADGKPERFEWAEWADEARNAAQPSDGGER